ncbi:hypothetical protein GGI19_005487 [Coemansia pectinata]|uniref:Uncharacterized protein n=1 Tax=Coemansia pectinata TaxID=1052879 RepID=A0A9W8GPH5_9FUNG|nr:hypothetical protein GGI19_005487 [Coemansia pectinata]
MVGNTRILSSGVTPDTDEYKWVLMTLLCVCQNFWAVVLGIVYKVNSQDIGTSREYHRKTMENLSSRRLLKYYQSLHPLTREVHLLLDKSSIYFGQALERLTHAPLDSWNFREIRKLKLQFYVPQWQQDDWDK